MAKLPHAVAGGSNSRRPDVRCRGERRIVNALQRHADRGRAEESARGLRPDGTEAMWKGRAWWRAPPAAWRPDPERRPRAACRDPRDRGTSLALPALLDDRPCRAVGARRTAGEREWLGIRPLLQYGELLAQIEQWPDLQHAPMVTAAQADETGPRGSQCWRELRTCSSLRSWRIVACCVTSSSPPRREALRGQVGLIHIEVKLVDAFRCERRFKRSQYGPAVSVVP